VDFDVEHQVSRCNSRNARVIVRHGSKGPREVHLGTLSSWSAFVLVGRASVIDEVELDGQII
jgi:hypothetical protein